jgi:hypothetical protein
MTDWINKTIYPPGIEKPNRLALFSAVGEVMSRVRKDAEKAFYAHFPYLADDGKLEEHGKALLIPHLLHDTPEEYRNRVATASFFLMKAGERAYIMGQLNERFGDRFMVIEKFLSIQTKVTDITDDERTWALSLFDSLTDPNIYLELSEWFHYIERVVMGDDSLYHAYRQDIDLFDDKICRNGRVLRDGKTVLPAKMKIFRNGRCKRNGTIYRKGFFYIPDSAAIRMPILRSSGARDAITVNFISPMTDTQTAQLSRCGLIRRNGEVKRNRRIKTGFDAIPPMSVFTEMEEPVAVSEAASESISNNTRDVFKNTRTRNGAYLRNGSILRSNYINELCNRHISHNAVFQENFTLEESIAMGIRKHHFRNGVYKRDGEIMRDSMRLIPLV